MPTAPKALIFDLGGVLYHVDTKESEKAFARLGLSDFERLYNLQEQVSLFDALETGRISEAEFCAHINRIAGLDLRREEVTGAWNALLLGMPEENVILLEDFRRRGHKIYLLSNTNAIHKEYIDAELHEQYGLDSLDSLFDEAFYSFRLGMRKPGLEIYEHVLKASGLQADQCFFIDDNEGNVTAARQVGIPTFFHPRNQPLEPGKWEI